MTIGYSAGNRIDELNTVAITCPATNLSSIAIAVVAPVASGGTTTVKTAPQIDGVDLTYYSITTGSDGWAIYYKIQPAEGSRTFKGGQVNYSGGYSYQYTFFWILTGVDLNNPFRTAGPSQTSASNSATSDITATNNAGDAILIVPGGRHASNSVNVNKNTPAGIVDINMVQQYLGAGNGYGNKRMAYLLNAAVNQAMQWNNALNLNTNNSCIAIRPYGGIYPQVFVS
jgi:hypothetical protein